MGKEVIAIFDIGKTNKKFFLFDKDFKEVYRDYTRLEQIEDEDGHPTENIIALHDWMKKVFHSILTSTQYKVTAINFSSYGASLVHLDDKGQVVAPLYNYTKEMQSDIISQFYDSYGPEDEFSRTTGSLNSGMLNSGMQLYWLKYTKPKLFSKINCSLHLPQYLSYVFTGIKVSDYTSIGSHTALWDYTKQDYHKWVYKEGLHKIMPSVVSTETSINMTYNGRTIKIGVGIHDSSSALLPYVRSIKKDFLLLSTGTWSIALNPFSDGVLSYEDVAANAINYMRINGAPVKASRLFLGNEYNEKIAELALKYNKPEDYHKQVAFDHKLYTKILVNFENKFRWNSLDAPNMPQKTNYTFDSYEEAFHQLVYELVQLQIQSIKMAIGAKKIKHLFIDGGFANNPVFIEFLSLGLDNIKIKTTDASLGSALGAALVISNVELDSKFLKNNYALKKHQPLIVN
ncbi:MULTISPECIES: FGGY-family carbohydrate kinase [Flavobacteriaceae]|uniref:FGGY-family carbohydrate kinase n=1 Tax=Flavobacteriaceae TaxID=49546 RepID=UPI0014917F8D|nr:MULTISPECIES: FGGY family carbohydrate kinase [Allomuricauda]MDC6367620.1 FGGY family carbohydrate kinase [Muricauda sp. AC10]